MSNEKNMTMHLWNNWKFARNSKFYYVVGQTICFRIFEAIFNLLKCLDYWNLIELSCYIWKFLTRLKNLLKPQHRSIYSIHICGGLVCLDKISDKNALLSAIVDKRFTPLPLNFLVRMCDDFCTFWHKNSKDHFFKGWFRNFK